MHCSQAVVLKLKTSGFTLLEMTLAASLGSVIVMLVLLLFSSSNKLYLQVTRLAGEMESGRFACFYLRNKLKNCTVKGLLANNSCFQQYKIKEGSDALEIICSENKYLETATIFVSKTNYQPIAAKNVFALFLKEEGKPRIEIASDISNMKIVYEVANNATYISANEVFDWIKVRGLKIILTTGNDNAVKRWSMYIATKNNSR